MPTRVVVVGIGADGWAGLAETSRRLVEDAEVVVGGTRQLGLLPQVEGQARRSWGSPFSLEVLDAFPGHVVVVASGDPMVSGVGSTLVTRYGADQVHVLPAVSSVALARARMGWPAETTEVVTVVGRRPETVLRQLAPYRRILVLSSDAGTPAALAALLVDAGYGDSLVTVLGDLGTDTETRTDGVAAAWTQEGPQLNVVAIDARGPALGSWVAGLPDDAYEHDGQLTKRDLRASALARLAPQPGQLLVDLGAGAGSVGIEWMRAHPTCRAVAVERDPERAARIARNAARLGVPGLVVERAEVGAVPEADAVFVGGGATVPGLLDRCRAALRPGGRLVVHGVTLETEQLLLAAHAEHGGELTRHSIELAEPLGSFRGWRPARAVTQWFWTAP